MVSSRWQKQNTKFIYSGAAIIITIYLLVGMFFQEVGPEKNGVALLVQTLVTIVAIILAYFLMKLRAKSMVRVLKIEYEVAVHAVLTMLKDKQIRFHRQKEEDQITFEFPEQSIKMTVMPYFFHNFVFTQKNNPQPATLVTLSELNENNQPFAKLLAKAIDEMAEQQPVIWEM